MNRSFIVGASAGRARARVFVLHVEDNPDDVELTKIAFKEIRFPYEIVVLDDGGKALDFLFAAGKFKRRDKRDTPALILLDLNLPKVHGLEVLKRLKDDPILKNVPVVALTSSNEKMDRKRAAALRTSLYIQKPVNFDDFIGVTEKIAELLAAPKPRSLKGVPVLLVDDSEDDVFFTRRAFEEAGVGESLRVVPNGIDALAYLRKEGRFRTAATPAVVLLDLHMPLRSGFEVLRELKADPALRKIPVIVLTDSQLDADVLRNYDCHPDAFLQKPLDVAKLLEAMAALPTP